MAYTVILQGGPPWGLRVHGGADYSSPLCISKINPNSKAYNHGVQVGDYVQSIGGRKTAQLLHNEALELIRCANDKLILELRREKKNATSTPQVNGLAPTQLHGNIHQVNGETGFVRTNATINYDLLNQDEEDMSGSTSDSQSSIIHVTGPFKPTANQTNSCESTSKPSTAVWSPGGVNRVKTYKPVSFSLASGNKHTAPSSSAPSTPLAASSGSVSGPSFYTTGASSLSTSPYSSINTDTFTTPSLSPPSGASNSSGFRQETLSTVSKSPSSTDQMTSKPDLQSTFPAKFSSYNPPPLSPAASPSRSKGLAMFLSQRERHSDQDNNLNNANFVQESPPVSSVSTLGPRSPTRPLKPYGSTVSPSTMPSTPVWGAVRSPGPQAMPSDQSIPSNKAWSPMHPTKPPNHPRGPSPPAKAAAKAWSPVPPSKPPRQAWSPVPPAKPSSPVRSPLPPPKPPSPHRSPMPPMKPSSPVRSPVPAFKPSSPVPAMISSSPVSGPVGVKSMNPQRSIPPAPPLKPTHLQPFPQAAKKLLRDSQETVQSPTAASQSLTSSTRITLSQSPQPIPRTTAAIPSTITQTSGITSRSMERDKEKTSEQDLFKDMRPIWSPTTVETRTRPIERQLEPQDFLAKKPARSDDLSPRSVPSATSSLSTSLPSSKSSQMSWNGTISSFADSKSGMPTPTSPTITLLQKNRERRKSREILPQMEYMADMSGDDGNPQGELIPPGIRTLRVEEGHIPKGAVYVGSKETVEGDKKHMDTYYLLPGETSTETKTIEKKAPIYDGIGPKDEKTGLPVGLRSHVDEKLQKVWYKQMYKNLHKADKSEEVNTYKPTYIFPEYESEPEREEPNPYHPSYEYANVVMNNGERRNSTMSLDRSLDREARFSNTSSPLGHRDRTGAWSPPHAKYRNQVYRNQPRSITEYEPGFSSIAFKEAKADSSDEESQVFNPPIDKPGQFSQYTEGKSATIKKVERPITPQSDVSQHQAYKLIQRGGDIPYEGLRFPIPEKKERSYSVPSPHPVSPPRYERSPSSTMDRRRRDEEADRRKEEMARITAEEKRKRWEVEMRSNEARRHSDFYMDDKYWLKLAGLDENGDRPQQKSPIRFDRFEEGSDAGSLQRPKKKVGTQIRGKAKALYSFSAQNPKELSFRRGDTMYLLRQIDKNWFEGEHHGRVGLFPKNYVEVITSLDDARQAAIRREGHATAKYRFTGQSANELSFKKGDTIFLIRRVDDNWYEGRVGDRQGLLPASYVEVEKEADTPLMTPMSSYAATPRTGSPGPLSPGSTISNGPAPTIPSAPMSPRGFDSFDLDFFSRGDKSGSPQHMYQQDYISNSLSPTSQQKAYAVKRSSPGYGSSSNGPSSLSDYGLSDYRDHPGAAGSYRKDFDLGPASPSAASAGGYVSDGPRTTSPYRGNIMDGLYNFSDSLSRKYNEPKYPSYRCLFKYVPQNKDELELQEGDIIYVMEKCDDGWYVGTSERTKEIGTFPGNYVTQL